MRRIQHRICAARPGVIAWRSQPLVPG
uniref:Uncharacterized protein n=1 Tax=Rhizophora mucronata TaxID=61149 RepID=A0A2P2R578_RHIMU